MHCFPGDNPVSMVSYACTTAVATVTITRQVAPRSSHRDRVPLLISLFEIPWLCMIVTAFPKIDVAVRFNTPGAGKVKKAWQEKLLDYFQDARGLGCVDFFDAQGNRSHVELTTLMLSPYSSLQEIFDRASTYMDRALQNERLGWLYKARCDYQDSFDFIHWSIRSRLYRNLKRKDETVAKPILQMLTTIGYSCACLCIKLGDSDWALWLINWTLEVRRDAINDSKAWYLCGLMDLTIGAVNGAAYCFLQALWNEPGNSEADEAVDELEVHLRSCNGLTERITLHNIEGVLQPFRHQRPGSAVMGKAEYIAHIQQWYIGMKEVDSIGYRLYNDDSVSWTLFERMNALGIRASGFLYADCDYSRKFLW